MSPADTELEIDSLIEAVHTNMLRLEQLTAGQVDSVVDHQGRTLLLANAQEFLRKSDAAKQAAILNALPAHIALLDHHGVILSVNQPWQRFALDNALQSPVFGVGLNYLHICDQVSGPDATTAAAAATGIRAVLAGLQPTFALEYPCHSSTEQRWFLLTATPLSALQPSGVVVMHLNITTERQAQERLLASELRFRQMAESISDVFLLRDLESNAVLYVSPAYELLWGRSCASLYQQPDSWAEAVIADDRAMVLARFQQFASAPTGTLELIYRILRPDGAMRWIEARIFPVADADGAPTRVAGVIKDITERKLAELKIARLNRIYAVLSGINSLIVRAQNRTELFNGACRIAVEVGKFAMAWIGVLDETTLAGNVVAWYGPDDEHFGSIKFTARADQAESELSSSRAARLLQPVICNDIATDCGLESERIALQQLGHHSMACFPLQVDGRAAAVISLFADEVGFFMTLNCDCYQSLRRICHSP